MSKTLGLALGAGGSRGVAHIGLLKALEEEGIRPDYICGCSMGSVVGACYAKGLSVKEMRDICFELKPLDIIDLNVNGLSQLGLLRSKKVQNLFLEYIGDITFDRLRIPFSCVVTDVLTGNLFWFKEGSVAIAVQASSAIPALFRPVEYKDMLLVDGCVKCRVPIRQVKEMGADVVIAHDVLYNTSQPVEKPKNMLTLLTRVFDIMDNNLTQRNYGDCEGLYDLLLEPEIEGMSQYVVKDLDFAYEEGYKNAKKNMDKIKRLLRD